MRVRAQGRSVSRGKSPSNNSNATTKKTTKLPLLISGSPDDYIPPVDVEFSSSGLHAGVCSQQGKRPYQEDEYSIRLYSGCSPAGIEAKQEAETHFFGLFDGHAGGKCSKHLSATLCDTLVDDSMFSTNLPHAVRRAFHTANDQFLKIAEKLKLHDGSTGITAIIRDRKILVANVGDCRALILSGGRPIQMSIDQKPTNPEEQKRIAALGGSVVYCMGVARVNRVLAVSRAFGNRTLRTVIRPDAEMMQRELAKEDEFLVMASDGLWDVLRNKDVCDVCYSVQFYGKPSCEIAEELVRTALSCGSMDNVTCIVVRLSEYVNRVLKSIGCSPAERDSALSSQTLLLGASANLNQSPMGSRLQESNGNSHSHSAHNVNSSFQKQASMSTLQLSDAGDPNQNLGSASLDSHSPVLKFSSNGIRVPVIKVASQNAILSSASADAVHHSPDFNGEFAGRTSSLLKSSSSSLIPMHSQSAYAGSTSSPLLMRSLAGVSPLANLRTSSPLESSQRSGKNFDFSENDDDDNITVAEVQPNASEAGYRPQETNGLKISGGVRGSFMSFMGSSGISNSRGIDGNVLEVKLPLATGSGSNTITLKRSGNS